MIPMLRTEDDMLAMGQGTRDSHIPLRTGEEICIPLSLSPPSQRVVYREAFPSTPCRPPISLALRMGMRVRVPVSFRLGPSISLPLS